MKLTGTYNGKTIELELTEEQIEALKQSEKKKTGWERVNKGETHLSHDGTGIYSLEDEYDDLDDDMFDIANYFSNETLAGNIIRAQTLQRKLWRRSAELCGKVDWDNLNVYKWYIWYNYDEKNICTETTKMCCDFGQVYFDTKEHAEQVIEEFKDGLSWYFTEFKNRMD